MVQNKSDKQASYGELKAQLDEIMGKLQAPDCEVDQAVELYEQAIALVKQLETYLQTAENRVKKVTADFDAASGSGV